MQHMNNNSSSSQQGIANAQMFASRAAQAIPINPGQQQQQPSLQSATIGNSMSAPRMNPGDQARQQHQVAARYAASIQYQQQQQSPAMQFQTYQQQAQQQHAQSALTAHQEQYMRHQQQQQLQLQQQQRTMPVRQNSTGNFPAIQQPRAMTTATISQMTTPQQQNHFNLQLAHAAGMPNLSPMVPMASRSSSITSATNNNPSHSSDLLMSKTASSSTLHRSTAAINSASSSLAAGSTSKNGDNSPSKISLTWEDRVILIAEAVMGGCQHNGFLRACSSAQRIKRQRIKQITAIQDKKEQQEGRSEDLTMNSDKGEAAFKKESLNVKTVKKIQKEMNDGVEYCNKVIAMINNVIKILDPRTTTATPSSSTEDKDTPRHKDVGSNTNSKIASTPLATFTPLPKTNLSNFNPCLAPVVPSSATGVNTNPTLSSHPSPYYPHHHSQLMSASSNPFFTGNIGPDGGTVMPQVDPAALLQQQQHQQQLRFQQQQSQHHHLQHQQMMIRSHSISSVANSPSQGKNMFSSMTQQDTVSSPQDSSKNAPQTVNQYAETTEAGNPNGSTLRKSRKRDTSKPTPGLSDEALLNAILASENNNTHDKNIGATKKKMSRKEAAYKCFAMTRFRNLSEGDYVAARLTSRDLWILARVVQDWQCPPNFNALEYSSLSESKRETIFQQNPVYVRDVEDKLVTGDFTSKAQAVSRHLVLPLPRSYSEASEWCTRCRKGSRVYAMYPSTTSLYGATVIDNTTYCRKEDDIIVVQFDGDETECGDIPQRHIPARFVTLVPSEFPAASSASQNVKRRTSTSSQKKMTPDATDASSTSNTPATKRRSSGTRATLGKKSKTSNESSNLDNEMFDVFYNHL